MGIACRKVEIEGILADIANCVEGVGDSKLRTVKALPHTVIAIVDRSTSYTLR